MKLTREVSISLSALILTIASLTVPSAKADLMGTVATPPTSTVFPGFVAPGTNPGTLLADLVEPFSTTVGTSGVLNTAVFQESGGTLDFYYQVENNAGSIDSLARETDTNFTGFTTSTGFRVDGSTLPGGFVNGTVAPVTADRNGPGDVVGFSFNPPDSAKIPPGSTSNVFVISTDATHFTNGTASLIDGGTTTIKAFEPQSAIPEPSELMAMALGLITLVALHGRRA
jgi:hypothetical protein